MTAWRGAALAHAEAEYPREACGLLVLVRGRLRYWRCRNLAPEPGCAFVMAPADRAAAEDAGEVVGVVHSHPDAPPAPSAEDVRGCDASDVPWHIVSVPSGEWSVCLPPGYRAPLVGRSFAWGSADCYGLIRDYYRQARGVELPDFPRAPGDFAAGRDLYRLGFPRAGFVEVSDGPREGDVLLFRLAAPVADHGAVWLPGDRILHHLDGRLSSRDALGAFFRERIVGVLRHEGGEALR